MLYVAMSRTGINRHLPGWSDASDCVANSRPAATYHSSPLPGAVRCEQIARYALDASAPRTPKVPGRPLDIAPGITDYRARSAPQCEAQSRCHVIPFAHPSVWRELV